MLVTETCCCMSGTMTGGKSRGHSWMNWGVSVMTDRNRTPISLHGCMMVEVIPRWQSSPTRAVIPSCKTTWVRLYKLLTAREMWSGTAYLTYMAMCWNSEARGTSYLSVSKDNTKTKKLGFIIIGSAITPRKWVCISPPTLSGLLETILHSMDMLKMSIATWICSD